MKNVFDFLTKDLSIANNDSVVVAVSGGADSMCLLNIFIELRKKIDINIICAHVNHNLRKESEQEKVLVEKFCKNNSVIFEYMKIENYSNDNFHSVARNIRYTFFESLINKYGAKYLATAHHGDDLIETVMMRIVRGSTSKGYGGFSKITEKENYKLIRPIIYITKEEAEEYCNKNSIEFATDQSNFKDIYTRNRYRKYLLPFLKSENSIVHRKFLKFSESVLEMNDYIDKCVDKNYSNVYLDKILDLKKFIKLDKVIQNKIIDRILSEIYGDDIHIIYDEHKKLVMNLILSNRKNSFVNLPKNVIVLRNYDVVKFEYKNNFENEYYYELKDNLVLNGKKFKFLRESIDDSNFVCRLNSLDVSLPLYVRNRKSGDKMTVKNMDGSKKIKNIFIEKHIPKQQRDAWPVVVDSNGYIVWLPGLQKSKINKQKNEKCDILIRYC